MNHKPHKLVQSVLDQASQVQHLVNQLREAQQQNLILKRRLAELHKKINQKMG